MILAIVLKHNKGSTWELLRAPQHTNKGEMIDCHIEDECSIHLEIYSSLGQHAPPYSEPNAVGVILATGNTGNNLSANEVNKNLYVSRDGGIEWKQVKSGNYLYNIGDHGAILLATKLFEVTDSIRFSWDFGQTWEQV